MFQDKSPQISKENVFIEETNGFKWLSHMEAVFRLSGTYRWVDGSNPKPFSDQEDLSGLNNFERQRLNEWLDMDSRANGLIHTKLSSQYRSKIYFSFGRPASENFAGLKNFILSQASFHEITLRQQLEAFSIEKNESITSAYN